MTIFLIAAFLFFLLVEGWLWHCDRLNLRDDHAAEVATLRAEHATERDHLARKYGEALKLTIAANDRADAAEAGAEWSEVMRAVLLAEIDRHDTSHVCVPSLDGIRAGRVPAREGEEPPISRSLSTAPVVRLHKKGAK